MRLRADRVAWRRTGDEVIALDLGSFEYLSLNRSGTLLWEHLADHADVDEHALAQLLVDTYELEAGDAASDVATFVAVMRDRDLLES